MIPFSDVQTQYKHIKRTRGNTPKILMNSNRGGRIVRCFFPTLLFWVFFFHFAAISTCHFYNQKDYKIIIIIFKILWIEMKAGWTHNCTNPFSSWGSHIKCGGWSQWVFKVFFTIKINLLSFKRLHVKNFVTLTFKLKNKNN